MLYSICGIVVSISAFVATCAGSDRWYFPSNVTFTAPSNYMRLCRHADITDRLWKIKISASAWYSVKVINQDGKVVVKTTAHLAWNISNPADQPIDGYAVHFERGMRSQMYPSIYPNNVCWTGLNHLWVKTNNRTGCEISNSSCDAETTENECLCPKNCSLYVYQKRRCRHIGNMHMEQPLGYFTIPSRVRYLEFPVQFGNHYAMDLIPYYRQYWGEMSIFSKTLMGAINDCPGYILKDNEISWKKATQICCDIQAPLHLPRNITLGKPAPDFVRNSLNITLYWLPPVDQVDFDTFTVKYFKLTHPRRDHNSLRRIQGTGFGYKRVGHNLSHRLADCDNVSVIWEITLHNIMPTSEVEIRVHSIYKEPKNDKLRCPKLNYCGKTITPNIPAVNPCDPEYHYCDVNAQCTAKDPTGRLTLNATCTCFSGFTGDGVNATATGFLLAEGCVNVNYCSQELSPCSSSAQCFDYYGFPGANCSCLSGYYGDGYANGTGCTHSGMHAVQIALPITVVVLAVAAVIAWKIQREKRKTLDIKWSQFVSNTALQYTIPPLETDSDLCLPTFGEKWEVDREKIRMEGVLGRGNYGVVYKGWLTKNKKMDMKFSDCEIPVAIKLIKEGPNEEQNLAEFLAEIGFMLNVGEHPNVLKVVGCCTTKKPILLITEFLKYGDLLHFLWDAREPTKCLDDPAYHVTEKSLYRMARQVAQGMQFLTNSRIIHGDLAARNILVGDELVCKISDFGLANDVYRYGVIKGHSERCVPFKWISPERMMAGKVPITSKSDVDILLWIKLPGTNQSLQNIFKFQCQDATREVLRDIQMKTWIKHIVNRTYGRDSDYIWPSSRLCVSSKVASTLWWSFGNLMYEMATLGCMPYAGMSAEELLDKLKTGYRMKQPSTCSDAMWFVISKCWKWKASSRPSFSELVHLIDDASIKKRGIGYINIAEAVDNVDKEEYAKELKPDVSARNYSTSSDQSSEGCYENKVFCHVEDSAVAKNKTVRFKHPQQPTSDIV